MLARMSHPMHTYLLGLKKNQSTRSSANARQTEPHRKPTTNRWTYVRLHTNRQTWKPNANRWTYIRLRTNKHTLEPKCHSMDLHQLPSTQQHNKLIGSRGLEPITVKHTLKQTDSKLLRSQALEPSNCQTTHTKRKKGARRDQLISCLRTSFGMRIRAT